MCKQVISYLGANATFTGGLSVQTEDSWCQFIGCTPDFFKYQGNDAEFYFEEKFLTIRNCTIIKNCRTDRNLPPVHSAAYKNSNLFHM